MIELIGVVSSIGPGTVLPVLFGLLWWFGLAFFGIRHSALTKKDPKVIERLRKVKAEYGQSVQGALLASPFVAVLCGIMTIRQIGRFSTMFGNYFFVAMLASVVFGVALAIHLYGDLE